MQSLEIRMLPQNASRDLDKMKYIANLVNRVYRIAEHGLYKQKANRTTVEDLQELTKKGEVAVAQLNEKIVGAIRIGQHDENTGELGMLSVDDAHQGQGIGRELISFAEQKCKNKGLATIQLELLVPEEGEHPVKKILEKWYLRLGYRPIYTDTIDSLFPQLNDKLAIPCNFIVFQKDLIKESIKS